MKTRRWLGLLCAVGVGFVAVSCDEEVPTAPQDVTSPTTTADASLAEEAAPTMPASNVLIQGTDVWGDCLNEDINDPPSGTLFNNATCTANDVEIKVLEALSVDFGEGPEPIPPGGTVTCVEGTTFEVELRAYFGLNAEERYDIGYFLAEDGGDARLGDCFHGFLDPIENRGGAGARDPLGGPPFDGPYADLETEDTADFCGDTEENDEQLIDISPDPIAAVIDVPQTIPVTCEDNDDDGFVEIGTCTSWDNNDKDTCENVDDAFPGTPSKCNCRPAALPINIQRMATVEVKKALSPTDDAGTFDLATYDYNDSEVDGADAVGHNGTTGQHQFTWYRDDEPEQNKASVEENGANLGSLDETTTPSAFDFYTTTYSCVESNNGNGPVSGSGTGPVDLTLENGDSWVCTFTNTRIPPPTVTVTKTAVESFDRAWSWQLVKTVFANGATAPAEVCSSLGTNIEGSTLPLQLGQMYTACYQVTATPGGPTDSNHLVTGAINVSVAASTAPYSANFTITDELDPGDLAAVVDCDGTAGSPFVNTKNGVAPGGSFSCTYSKSLTPAEAAAVTTDTATASVSWNTGDSGTDKGNAASTFTGVTPTNESDETADVTDIFNGTPVVSLGDDVLASGGPYVYTFAKNLQCPDYGDTLIPNDAYLDSNDGGYDLEDDGDVTVSCPRPPDGCTLTQGFWRTHSQFGPAPYSDNWEVITPSGADTEFSEGFDGVIDSDLTYYEVLWDAGKGGNAWFKLGHQYIAAQLNILNGADPSLVSGYMADAQSILDFYDKDAPGKDNSIPKQGDDWCQTYGGDCTGYNSDRQYAMHLNNLLTSYNEGTLPGGPLHCDDDAQSFYGLNIE
jgi:hypothetical protein